MSKGSPAHALQRSCARITLIDGWHDSLLIDLDL